MLNTEEFGKHEFSGWISTEYAVFPAGSPSAQVVDNANGRFIIKAAILARYVGVQNV